MKLWKKIIHGTSDAWSMSRSSQRPRDPAYYIEDCWIYSQYTFSAQIWFSENQVLMWWVWLHVQNILVQIIVAPLNSLKTFFSLFWNTKQNKYTMHNAYVKNQNIQNQIPPRILTWNSGINWIWVTLQTHPCNENRVFSVKFFSQGETCSLYREPCSHL